MALLARSLGLARAGAGYFFEGQADGILSAFPKEEISADSVPEWPTRRRLHWNRGTELVLDQRSKNPGHGHAQKNEILPGLDFGKFG